MQKKEEQSHGLTPSVSFAPSDLFFVYCHTAVFYFIKNFSTDFLVLLIPVPNLALWGSGADLASRLNPMPAGRRKKNENLASSTVGWLFSGEKEDNNLYTSR